jgi:hypothetical protein
VVRDSAGIRIVENTTPLWQPGEEWRLSETPAIDIGTTNGDSDQQLFRVVNAFRMRDNRIVIANAGTHELRFYDAVGNHLHSVGREGDGPGEFRSVIWFERWIHDSLVTVDIFQRRLSIFDPRGTFVRSFQFQDVSGVFPWLVGVFEDGRVLARVVGQPSESRSWIPAGLYLYDGHGVRFDSVGSDSGMEAAYTTLGNGIMGMIPLPFARFATVSLGRDRFLVGVNDAYEFKVFAPTGALLSIVRRRVEPQAVTSGHLDAEVERLLEGYRDSNLARMMERRVRDVPYPPTLPAFGPVAEGRLPSMRSLILDRDGNIWVMEYDRPAVDDVRWSVFDPSGVMLGTVDFPDGFVLLDVGRAYVIGHWQDDLDVEHVQLYDLIKPVQ